MAQSNRRCFFGSGGAMGIVKFKTLQITRAAVSPAPGTVFRIKDHIAHKARIPSAPNDGAHSEDRRARHLRGERVPALACQRLMVTVDHFEDAIGATQP
jgi:hypothetical protein